MIEYGLTKILDISFEQALNKISEELKKEGFGILTTIDVKEKFKEKLGIDFQKYVILGACNPTFAHKAILAEENIGLMLPCNVILYEKDNNTVLSIIKPSVAMNMINNNSLTDIAQMVEEKLQRVFKAV